MKTRGSVNQRKKSDSNDDSAKKMMNFTVNTWYKMMQLP